MMAPANHYSNYYDPVGSHANQPQGYTYQPSSTSPAPFLSPATSAFSHNAYQNYGNSYEQQQQYGAASHQPVAPGGGANRAAAAILSNLGNSAFSPVNRPSSLINQYNHSDDMTRANQMPSSFGQPANHRLAHQSSVFSSDTQFGKFVAHSPQSNAGTHGDSQQSHRIASVGGSAQTYQNPQSTSMVSEPSYQTSYAQQGHQPTPRYNSPVHVMSTQQPQQAHNPQTSRATSHRKSPLTASRGLEQANKQQRQQSMSVEPSPTTVDPSQVYDFRAEQQRKAQIEAQKRKKLETEQAAWQAEEAARQAERERMQLEQRRIEEDSRQAQEAETARKAAEEAARKEAAEELKKEQRRNARKEKRQRVSAASTLHQIASSDANEGVLNGDTEISEPLNDDEAQMRAMFKRMREFNQKNPAMLAKLWEEERQAHAASPRAQSRPPSQPPPSAPPNRPVTQSSLKPVVAETSFSKPRQPDLPPQAQAQRANTPAAAPGALVVALTRDTPPNPDQDRNKTKPPGPSLPGVDPNMSGRAAEVPPQQASTTLWPPHKKGIVADAAAKWLSNLPTTRAAGRTVTREEIQRVLDSNPSYAQLCEAIERLGIRFERSLLARELLKVVPGGLKAQTLPKGPAIAAPFDPNTARVGNSTPPGTFTTGHPNMREGGSLDSRLAGATVGYHVPMSVAQPAIGHETNRDIGTPLASMDVARGALAGIPNTIQHSSIPPTGIPDRNSNQPLSQSPQVKAEADIMPQVPPKQPANKEEAARKRTFSDLVDLTEGDSDDEIPPLKTANFQPLTGNNVIPPTGGFQHPLSTRPYYPAAYQNGYPANTSPLGTGNQVGDGLLTSIPNTIPPPKPKGPTQEHKQMERIRGKMLVEPLMRDRVARRSTYDIRTIARDVLLATGRHPDMRALNAHLNPMDKLLSTHGGAADGVGNKSDLSTIRWDIIDPDPPSKTEKGTGSQLLHEGNLQKVDDNGERPGQYHTSVFKVTRPVQTPQGSPAGKGNSAKKKRRGRPPGSQSGSGPRELNLVPPSASASLGSSPARQQNTPERGSLSAQGSMSSSKLPDGASSAVGYAAFRQIDEFGNVIKKKGRPVGWRKNIHSREANGLAPASHPKTPDARPRPAAYTSKKKELQSPHYEVYHCQWRDCTAELHNMETLEKHIGKLHSRTDDQGRFECAWRGCSATANHVDPQGQQRSEDNTLLFSDVGTWLDHIVKQHLRDIAWKLGDGPRGGSLSDHAALQSNAQAPYLSDAHGRSVTPVISPGPSTTGEQSANLWASPHMLRDGMSKSERQAAAALKELEDAKRAEGPYMGTEGTILANTKRRLGFLDDEDFADEVDSSELGEE